MSDQPQPKVLFEAEVPPEYSRGCQGTVRRVRVYENENCQGGVIIVGMDGWHPDSIGSGRDMTADEKSDWYGGIANEGERECVALLLAEIARLRAENSEIEITQGLLAQAESVALERERRIAGLERELAAARDEIERHKALALGFYREYIDGEVAGYTDELFAKAGEQVAGYWDTISTIASTFTRSLSKPNYQTSVYVSEIQAQQDREFQEYLKHELEPLLGYVVVNEGDWIVGKVVAEIERLKEGHDRYEIARRMNPRQWAEACELNTKTGKPFDEIIDEIGKKGTSDE